MYLSEISMAAPGVKCDDCPHDARWYVELDDDGYRFRRALCDADFDAWSDAARLTTGG